MDASTYCEEPSGPREEYVAWLSDFKLETKKGDISELLVANAQVRSLYTQMVSTCNTFLLGAWIVLCMRPANERQRYIITSCVIGWVQTQNDPCGKCG